MAQFYRKIWSGIVGITNTSSVLATWALSYNLRSDIASKTYEIFHANADEMLAHKESSKGRKGRYADVEKLVRDDIVTLKIFAADTEDSEVLQRSNN